ncbi:MAG TPA: hypothetical protein VFU47_17900, partial [Armatimonadota bacterium]|nr:hypothetical protein [Armatimonadota bacterium]
MRRWTACLLLITGVLCCTRARSEGAAPGGLPTPLPEGLSAEDRAAIERDWSELERRLARVKRRDTGAFADADLFRKSVFWALRYEPRL